MSAVAAVGEQNAFYMACLDLTDRSCLVVGAGPVGLEKTEGLVRAGARVTVVSPDFVPAFADLPIERLERRYETSDLDGRFLVVAATSENDVNRQVFADAEARSLLCNVADVPELCSFILPAVHRTGPIAVAVSTGGASPALAQRLRTDIAELIGPDHVELAHRLRELRPWAKANLATYEERRDYFAGLVEEALR
jgi:precorrin-2 dehydrogenase / sirohydrochlorin ferrochelatase